MDLHGDQAVRTPPTSQSTPVSGTTSDPPRPCYFISRNDGTLTPLIAVDELPASIRIIGAPAVISPAATVNMMSLGVKDRSQYKYNVETSDSCIDSHSGKLSLDSVTIKSEPSVLEKPLEAPNGGAKRQKVDSGAKGVEEWRQSVKTIDETQAAIDAVIDANENATAVPTSGTQDAATPGTFGKKVYCTHWIRWGECDYTQQGCLYRHEMPDELTLNAIGIRTIPKWYRDADAPKNGWVGRPAPADQLWRGPPQRPAQPPQPIKPITKPVPLGQRPAPIPHPGPHVFSAVNAAGPYIGHAPPGPKAFGNANKAMEQRPPPRPATATLHYAPVPPYTNPRLSPFTSPARNTYVLPSPAFRPLVPVARSAPPPPAPPISSPAPSPYVEPQTPVPVHRRLFVPPGEAKFVINAIPVGEERGKAREGKKCGSNGKVARGKAGENLLVDV